MGRVDAELFVETVNSIRRRLNYAAVGTSTKRMEGIRVDRHTASKDK